MIYSVFCDTPQSELEWQSELLGYSWGCARQPGELVRLTAAQPQGQLTQDRLARVVHSPSWSPHPYTGDVYASYHRVAALLEWLVLEQIEGTILLLETTSVFRAPIHTEVDRGYPRAVAWPGMPCGVGPFGLGPDFEFLTGYCVDRTLDVAAVALPLMIHSADLRRMAARWLELIGIIRVEMADKAHCTAYAAHADRIAYAIAAAEIGLRHTMVNLLAETEVGESDAPIYEYRRSISSTTGGTAWDPTTYRNWDPVQPDAAPIGPGRDFLELLAGLIRRRAEGLELAFLRPSRHKGVREGRLLGSLFLEIPGRPDTISLNSSGAAIWEACDGARSLAEINRELESRFQMPAGSLRADVEVVIKRLERIGALRLVPV